MIYIELLHNLSVLVALSVLSFFVDTKWPSHSASGAILQGVLFGIVAMLVILNPIYVQNEILFDGRSVALSLVTLYFGPISGIIATSIASTTQIAIGGIGAYSGVLSILISFAIGLAFRIHRKNKLEPPSTLFLYFFGILVHVCLLGMVFLGLPIESRSEVLRSISLPILATFPLATIVVGKVLSKLLQTRNDLFSLNEGKTFYQRLFIDHSAIKLLLDVNTGQILDANTSASLFYGCRLEELKSKFITDINILTDAENKLQMEYALELKKNHFTHKQRLANGQIRDVDVYSSPIFVNGRKVLYSIIHDVTDRVLSEQQVHLNISALNSASNGILITDTKGSIVWANRSFSDMSGYDLNEAFGRNPRELVRSGHQTKDYYKKMWDTILRGDVWLGELVNRRKDGSTYFEEMSITPVKDRSDNITHFIAIKQDITERKHIADQILMNMEELKKTNSELDRFVYSTSHELRAPLLSVLGLIDLNMESFSDNKESSDYLLMMKNSIQRADDTIKQILHYSRNSRLGVATEPVNIRDIVDLHIQDIRHMTEAKGVRFNVDIPLNAIIESDSMRLRIIIHSLITNAVQYQRQAETDKWIRISFEQLDDSVVFTVQDNGEGIPENKFDSIFEMFKRESSLSTGPGLGLYMVREMILRLNGTITVTSTFGEGSRFVVTLPKSRPASQ